MEATRIDRISKSLRDDVVTAAYLAIDTLDGEWKLSKDLKTVTDTNDVDEYGYPSVYGMLYFKSGAEIIAVPDFYVGESALLIGSLGNAYTLDYETPVAA